MPKEVIHDEAGSFDLAVGWTREPAGHVQVGAVMAAGQPIDAPPNTPRTLKQLVASWPDDAGDPDHPAGATGLWSTLDRAGCNRLIRTLRKARDAAFGRDE
jgi:hypothetical protein